MRFLVRIAYSDEAPPERGQISEMTTTRQFGSKRCAVSRDQCVGGPRQVEPPLESR